jgi:hypothetical protein
MCRCGDPHFSYCGWRVGFAYDCWWLLSLLWLLCLGHMRLNCFIVWVVYACLDVCLSSFDKTLGSPLQGELASLVRFDAWFVLPRVQGGMVFYIEKPRILVTTLLSWKLVVAIHMAWFEESLCFALVWGRVCAFILYICIVCFSLTFALHTHLSHFASPVILAYICLIMLIIVLG